MIFRPDMIEPILAGRKTQTRRPAPVGTECRYKVGQDYAVQPGRSKRSIARIRIVSIDRVPVGSLTVEDARAEGFRSPQGFYDRWSEFYGGIFGYCWRIEFELVSR